MVRRALRAVASAACGPPRSWDAWIIGRRVSVERWPRREPVVR